MAWHGLVEYHDGRSPGGRGGHSSHAVLVVDVGLWSGGTLCGRQDEDRDNVELHGAQRRTPSPSAAPLTINPTDQQRRHVNENAIDRRRA
jgi:hypothetical protein